MAQETKVGKNSIEMEAAVWSEVGNRYFENSVATAIAIC